MSRRSAILLAMAVVLVAGAWLALAGSRWVGMTREGQSVPVETVERRAFARVVPAEGVLQAVRATPVSVPAGAPAPARVGWIAEDGSRVRAGEVVVRFDPSDVEKELQQAEDDLARARLKLEKERVHGLAEVRKLERDLALARDELADARQFQKKDELVFSRHEIVESEIDQDLARRREAHAQGARAGQASLSGAQLSLLGIDLRQAEARIERSRKALAGLAVAAPHDGVLVLKRNRRGEPVRVGDMVWTSQALAAIPDLSRMEAEVYVLEADAGGLAPGKPATVVLESRPGIEHAARIARVDSLAKPRFRGSPVQYFGVILALDRTEPGIMKPGQRVRALLRLDERPAALTVPRQAVLEREGRMVVYRKSRLGDTGFEPVEVELGPSGAGRVVVERGLAEGDVVALADPTRPEEAEETPAREEGTPAP